ncbi:MAG: hypothetical protein EZS28_037811, partial [Streblomastix strix]
GLRIIHAKGLVHRDIKGENLMMHCPPGSNRVIVKIADFGLVKDQGALQQTMLMSAKGTPLNMAPELVIGDGRASAKVDIYSAGVVIYQLAYHEYPIKAGSIQDLMKLMQQQKISRPAVIKDNLLWNFICHCLNFDRTQRYSAEQALQDPYFTGPLAQQEISQEARQIAVQLQLAQQNGDKSVTLYDINPSFTVPKTEIKTAISYDPDVDLQPIYAQIPTQQIYQQQQQSIRPLQSLSQGQINPALLQQNPGAIQQQQQQFPPPGFGQQLQRTGIFQQPPPVVVQPPKIPAGLQPVGGAQPAQIPPNIQPVNTPAQQLSNIQPVLFQQEQPVIIAPNIQPENQPVSNIQPDQIQQQYQQQNNNLDQNQQLQQQQQQSPVRQTQNHLPQPEENEVQIPCEICDKLIRASKLEKHQQECAEEQRQQREQKRLEREKKRKKKEGDEA